MGIDRGAVYELIHAGKLRYARLNGGTMIVPAAALQEFLDGANEVGN